LDVLQGEDEYVEESSQHADSFHTTRPVPSSSATQHTYHQHNAVRKIPLSQYMTQHLCTAERFHVSLYVFKFPERRHIGSKTTGF